MARCGWPFGPMPEGPTVCVMLKGFKDFILRGNVIDLAVAVVMGAAFTALVGAVAQGLFDPMVRVMVGGSADNLGGTVTINGQVLDSGLIMNATITFLITAAVVYFICVAPMNKYRAMREAGKETVEELEAKEGVLLQEIRTCSNSAAPERTARPDPAHGNTRTVTHWRDPPRVSG